MLHPKCGINNNHAHPHRETVAAESHASAARSRALPVGPVNPLAQVKAYIDGIMDRVQPDGWCGPPPDGGGGGAPAGKTGPLTSTCKKGWNLFG